MERYRTIAFFVAASFVAWQPSDAADFVLLTGVDARHNLGSARLVTPVPGPGFPTSLFDGDRLAGTSDTGPIVNFVGNGTPMFQPNAFGSFSFTVRRGSIPAGGPNHVALLGIDFLGGPLLDLDGNLGNGVRSLVPVFGANAAIIPDSASLISLSPDFDSGTVALTRMDMTGTNEGAPNFNPLIATTISVLAGTGPTGVAGSAINPSIDTRMGSFTQFSGTNGDLGGVYRIEDLGFEVWQDSIDPDSSSAGVLGTIQYLGTLRGWLVIRDPITGEFPALAGVGIGSTGWPAADASQAGHAFFTANGLQGGIATITTGPPGDDFTTCGTPPGNCNGGTAMSDFGGDLGGYFDHVIVPRLAGDDNSFVYLESAGFGINNSFDPIFGDTVGWDVVIVAASKCGVLPDVFPGDLNDDLRVDLDDYALFGDCVSGPGAPAAELCLPVDFDGDDDVDLRDFGGFQSHFGATITPPPCLLGGD